MNKSCMLDKPYPKIEVNEKSREKALLILPSYSGEGSEMTAINDYFYQSLITETQDKAMSEMLECISICEMKHFHILGEIIYSLGVLPKLYAPVGKSRKTKWFSGSYVDYTVNRYDFLKENIERENKAIKEYTALISKIKNENIEENLKRIILDERHHIEIFESLLQ